MISHFNNKLSEQWYTVVVDNLSHLLSTINCNIEHTQFRKYLHFKNPFKRRVLLGCI